MEWKKEKENSLVEKKTYHFIYEISPVYHAVIIKFLWEYDIDSFKKQFFCKYFLHLFCYCSLQWLCPWSHVKINNIRNWSMIHLTVLYIIHCFDEVLPLKWISKCFDFIKQSETRCCSNRYRKVRCFTKTQQLNT